VSPHTHTQTHIHTHAHAHTHRSEREPRAHLNFISEEIIDALPCVFPLERCKMGMTE
jgi:hypothetical protein